MRAFVTLCILAVAYAKPQYNYGSGVSGTFGGSSNGLADIGFLGAASQQSFGSSSGIGSSGFGGINRFTSGSNSGLSGSSSGFSSAGFAGNNGFSSGSVGDFSGSTQTGGNFALNSQQSGQFEAPLVHKQFITVSAPEDNENLERTKHLVIGRPQKNYRVVFIKAPSASNANVKLSAEYAPKEEKTVIYVLTKKDSTLEVNDIATPAPTQPSKPEVFFIKYKTEQEAQHAQQEIQAQYDKIEGSSEHVNGGVAPQKSVIGALDGNHAGAVGTDSTGHFQTNSFGSNGASSSAAASYLPPSH